MTTYPIISSILGILGFPIAVGNLIWNFVKDRERFEIHLEHVSGIYGPVLKGVIRNVGNCSIYLEKILVRGPGGFLEQIPDAANQHIGAKQNYRFDLERYQVKEEVNRLTLEVFTKTGKCGTQRLKKL